MRRSIRVIWLAMLFIATLAGCVADAIGQMSDASGIAAAKKRGKLVVGIKYDFPPMGYVNEQKQVVGFEVDMARELAASLLGNRDAVELVEVSGPNRIPFLVTGKVDLIIAELTITPERAKTVSFSDPYYTGGYTIMVAKETNDISTMPSLAGKRVGVTRGSTADTIVGKLSPAPQDVLKLEHISELFSAIQAKRVDAVVQDVALLQPFVSKNPGYKLVGGLYNEEAWGIGVRKDDAETVAWVNDALKRMKQSGWMNEALRRWGLR
jgi:ABC-type amino acid transport substrate-binding protein